MELRFKAERLQKLAYDNSYTADLPASVVTAFRKRMQAIRAAHHEQVLLTLAAWLHLEKPDGNSDHHSIRITDEWQLLLEFEDGTEERVAVIEAMMPIEKEHRS